MRRRALVLAAVVVTASLWGLGVAPARSAAPCPATLDPATFATAEELRDGNEVMDDLGPRPTASPAHEQFIRWIERQVDGIGGLDRRSIDDAITRQLETGARLSIDGPVAGAADLAVANAVPYARPAPAGVTGPLIVVPAGTAIADSAEDLTGRIVVRDAATASIPFAVFGAVAYYIHDPDLTFDPLGSYERDWLGAAGRIADLQEAEARGAAGVLFVHTLPRDQVAGQYAPYTGETYGVPALYLGVDEGTAIRDRLAAGEPLTATVATVATQHEAPTRTVVATLPGLTAERIVVQSHTDGMNAVWDNGPIAMLALAEAMAALPIECRARTIEFVFTTAHLHLTHSGAERYAELLDEQYDDGTVAFVVAIEHLGAREFAAVPRTDGPGRRLEATGQPEMLASFVSESPVLALSLIDRVVAHDLRRTVVLRGADAPQVAFPPHRSFGGEGGPYRTHLIPTVAAITGPWTLFDPAFGLDELVDPELMRRQALAFGDIVVANDDVPRTILAGADTAYRVGRDLVGSEPLVTIPSTPELPGAAPSPLGSLNAGWFCGLLGLG